MGDGLECNRQLLEKQQGKKKYHKEKTLMICQWLEKLKLKATSRKKVILSAIDLIILKGIQTRECLLYLPKIFGNLNIITLVLLNPDMPCICKQCSVFANSVDPDQLASEEFVSKTWIKQTDWLTIRSGWGILNLFSIARVNHTCP